MTPASAPADALPEDRGAAGLWQKLLKLRTTASAIHITAHPDDEDGGTLTLLSRGKGAHVTLLTLNRGEGGADLIAPFFFDSLGVLRTLELLQADRYYGVDQYFTRVTDYGFSKTMEEALRKWGGEDAVLRDVVRVVRRERPEVIIARFQGAPRDGHGNHQTAGLMAKLVFDAAGDPNRFPEQIRDEGLKPWRPKKLYQDNIRPDFRPEDKDAYTLVVDSGQYDPVLGRSYIQISREGLNFQRSQGGGGRAQPAGEFKSYYRLLRSARPGYNPQREESFFDGLDTSIAGIALVAGDNPPAELSAGLKTISDAVEGAVSAFDAKKPEATVPQLTVGLRATRELLGRLSSLSLSEDARDQISFLLKRKERQFQSAIATALALDLDAAVQPDKPATGPFAEFMTPPTFNHATPGQSFAVRVRLVNRSRTEVKPTSVEIAAPKGWTVNAEARELKPISYNQAHISSFNLKIPEDEEPTRPYWRRDNIEQATYEITDPQYMSLPLTPPPAWADVKVEVLGTEVEMRSPVHVTIRNAPYGFITPALTVVPAISVRFPVEQGVIPLGRNQYKVSAVVHSSVKGPAKGTLKLDLPQGWTSNPAAAQFSFDKEDEEAPFDFVVTVPAKLNQA